MDFSASYDRTTKVVSAVACLVLLGAALLAGNLVVACVTLAVTAVAFAFSPRGYRVADDAIVVKRWIGNVTVPLADALQIRRATEGDFAGTVRLWGSGGLFGYYGRYSTSKLGSCRWFVTNRDNSVVVATGSGVTIFSPDDVAGFLAALPAVAPQALPFTPARSAKYLGFVIGGVIAVVALAVVALALSYSPGPPRLTLIGDSLTIHDRFYGVTVSAARVDTAGIRVVDIRRDPYWMPTARTNGFSNSHYHSGWFRVAGGVKARMYWTTAARLVLLPPKGADAPVLVEVADPEAFARSLRAQWAR